MEKSLTRSYRRAWTQMGFIPPGMSHTVQQTSGQAWHRLYLFSGRQCRTRVGVRMYMSQLAYKTVAFALILEHDCAAARVPAGFIKRIFQSHRRRCRSREPVATSPPGPSIPSLSAAAAVVDPLKPVPPLPPPPPRPTVNLFSPSGADTPRCAGQRARMRHATVCATLKANDGEFLRLVSLENRISRTLRRFRELLAFLFTVSLCIRFFSLLFFFLF